jgi:hypothetical protein
MRYCNALNCLLNCIILFFLNFRMEPTNSFKNTDQNIVTSLEIKQKLSEWILSSSSHGLPNLFRSKRISIKLFWLVCFLGSLVICSFLIVQTIISYLQYDVTTNYRVYYESMPIFPTITVCPKNMFNTHDAQKFLDDLKRMHPKESFEELFSEANISLRSQSIIYQTFIRMLGQAISQSDKFDDDKRKKLSHPFNKFVYFCRYLNLECNQEDFEWYFDWFYGNCYRFNTGRSYNGNPITLKRSTRVGKYTGLQMILYVGISPELNLLDQSNGAHLFIGNSSHPIISLEGVDVSPGTETNIVLNKISINQLEKPYSECVLNLDRIDSFDSDMYRETFSYNKTYRLKDCIELCLVRFVINRCNCSYGYNLKKHQICTDLKGIECYIASYLDFYQNSSYENCVKECPRECSTTLYPFSLSFSKFPSRSYAKTMMNDQYFQQVFSINSTSSYEMITENFMYLDIYFEELKTTVISEAATLTFVSLLANIGGTLGLFLVIYFKLYFILNNRFK